MRRYDLKKAPVLAVEEAAAACLEANVNLANNRTLCKTGDWSSVPT